MLPRRHAHRDLAARASRTPDGKHGHVVDYRHVIHALRRKPMALLNLVYRDQLFPAPRLRPCVRRLARRQSARTPACRTMVGLLALAHERACEAELAVALRADARRRRPARTSRRSSNASRPKRMALPVVIVTLPSLAIYDQIAAAVGEAA